jgi:hypothetical protein
MRRDTEKRIRRLEASKADIGRRLHVVSSYDEARALGVLGPRDLVVITGVPRPCRLIKREAQ